MAIKLTGVRALYYKQIGGPDKIAHRPGPVDGHFETVKMTRECRLGLKGRGGKGAERECALP